MNITNIQIIRDGDRPKLFLHSPNDNVLTDEKGRIISKKDFDFMISQVYETYQNLTDEEIEKLNKGMY